MKEMGKQQQKVHIRTKEEYIEAINKEMNDSEDIQLLDLIHQLLKSRSR